MTDSKPDVPLSQPADAGEATGPTAAASPARAPADPAGDAQAGRAPATASAEPSFAAADAAVSPDAAGTAAGPADDGPAGGSPAGDDAAQGADAPGPEAEAGLEGAPADHAAAAGGEASDGSTAIVAPAAAADAGAGDALLRAGALSEPQVREVLQHQNRTGLGFDAAALALGLATAADVEMARARLARGVVVGLQPSGRLSDELVILSRPTSPQAEAIRLLRTQIISQHIGAGRRAFAVAAAVAGSGVTFIASNLAAALAQVGIKTLLVDANLRDPRIDSIFGLEPGGPGLTSFLGLAVGRPERVLYPDVLPNLSVIPSGPAVARPQELLSGARFRAGVDLLLREFDVAIFDTAPANESADALTVAGVIGYALLVARRDSAYVRDVRVLSDQLAAARATLIGSVLNIYE